MTNEIIRKILENHGVPCYEQNGRIFADSMYAHMELFEQVEDLTGYTKQQLLNWLGY